MNENRLWLISSPQHLLSKNTIYIIDSDYVWRKSWYEMLVLKLSGIQNGLWLFDIFFFIYCILFFAKILKHKNKIWNQNTYACSFLSLPRCHPKSISSRSRIHSNTKKIVVSAAWSKVTAFLNNTLHNTYILLFLKVFIKTRVFFW